METAFTLPKNAIGRFGVVKLWPEIKTAEDECIARLKIAANLLGIECIEIHPDGRMLSDPTNIISNQYIDFVIHLHYDTPKYYDAFSFVALWNPIKFYHEWGYQRCSRNLTTHDDFLSCSSVPANDHVSRLIRNSKTHLTPLLSLHHSPHDVIHPPSLGYCKLFYAGINWEAITGKETRHQQLLKQLDKSGKLRIYGPETFQGVKVWKGYQSYVREIPFDGISLIDEISKTGVALVLSSQSHIESELMSNRLFESIAAGALVICDENPFAYKHFGDSLFYIDSRASMDQTIHAIDSYLKFARENQDTALAMISKAQSIFRDKFSLLGNLIDLYNNLEARKLALRAYQCPDDVPPLTIQLFLLMPDYCEAIVEAHIKSVCVQEYKGFSAKLVIDNRTSHQQHTKIESLLAKSSTKIDILKIDFFNYNDKFEIKSKRNLGEVLDKLINTIDDRDSFIFVAPNEVIFSNHLSILSGALRRDENIQCAATAAVIINHGHPIHSVHELIDFNHVDRNGPPGYGRFIFRKSSIPHDISIALNYLNGRPLAVLIGEHDIEQLHPATIIIYADQEFPKRTWDDIAESEIIRDYSPNATKLSFGFGALPLNIYSTTPPVPAITLLQLTGLCFNRNWLRVQFQLIRKQGISKRLQVLRRKLGL